MTSGTAKPDFKALASQGLTYVGIGASSINYQQGANGLAPIRIGKNVTHAAQVAFAFFTHIANENNVACGLQASMLERRADRKHRYHAGGVVADSRSKKLIAFLSRSKLRARRENCIQMCAHADQRRLPVVIKKAEDIAEFVVFNSMKSQILKAMAQPFAACSLTEWRRGNLRELHLPAAELHLLVVQIMKSLVHCAQLGNVGYFLLRGGGYRFRDWAADWHGLNRILTG